MIIINLFRSCEFLSWATIAQINGTRSSFYNYISSVYWSCATLTSTGYGDIVAISRRGELIVVLTVIAGLLLYGYCTCSTFSTMLHLLAPRQVNSFSASTIVRGRYCIEYFSFIVTKYCWQYNIRQTD